MSNLTDRFTPPNMPSLTFPERVAFGSLADYLTQQAPGFNKALVFNSEAEGRKWFVDNGVTAVGQWFVNTGVNDIGSVSINFYVSNITHTGWLTWDTEWHSYQSTPWPTVDPDYLGNFSPNGGYVLGNGTDYAEFYREGINVWVRWGFALGSTSTVAAFNGMTLPFAQALSGARPGFSFFADDSDKYLVEMLGHPAGAKGFIGHVRLETQTTFRLICYNAADASNFLVQQAVSSTVPFTWGATDEVTAFFRYERD